jgi:phospholipid transport system transporter-binding protein
MADDTQPGGRLDDTGGGALMIHGPLKSDDVAGLYDALPVEARTLRLDLAGVTAVDSAAVALLLDWRWRQQAAGGALQIAHAPDSLRRLAAIGGVDRLLGIEGITTGATAK